MISFNQYNHLGNINYYFNEGSEYNELYESISALIPVTQDKKRLDTTSILEVLNKNYMFGDRTIFHDVKRTPWMAKPNSEKNGWDYYNLPLHGRRKMTPEEISSELFGLLKWEVKKYIGDKQRVGILLSGGMDSRIVAGILHNLIVNKETNVSSVVAYTWGNGDSRDVVYAKRIADHFKWDWKHYVVSAEELWENIQIAGKRGCEYTGFHLHAIPQIAKGLDVEVVLAGSYGDSVGRAEYSGRHVSRLVPLDASIRNPAFLMKNDIYKQSVKGIAEDIGKYHKLVPRKEQFQQLEIDYQCHYMRRMLNPCMELINEKVPFRQAFTAPEVFGFMWSLDPSCRGNEPYYHILKKLDSVLSEIPWARTGKRYLHSGDVPDTFKKKHHSYDVYVQDELIERIKERLRRYHIQLGEYFNVQAVLDLVQLVRVHPGYNFDFLERLIWLVSFTYFLEEYNIPAKKQAKASLRDTVNARLYLPMEYMVKRMARKIKILF